MKTNTFFSCCFCWQKRLIITHKVSIKWSSLIWKSKYQDVNLNFSSVSLKSPFWHAENALFNLATFHIKFSFFLSSDVQKHFSARLKWGKWFLLFDTLVHHKLTLTNLFIGYWWIGQYVFGLWLTIPFQNWFFKFRFTLKVMSSL